MKVRHRVGRRVLAPLVMASALAIGGCGGGTGSGDASSARGASAPASASTSATPATTTPSGNATGVAPATGLVMDDGYVRMRAPQGWTATESSLRTGRIAADKRPGPTAGSYVGLNAMPARLLTQQPIEDQARDTREEDEDYQRIAGYPRYDDRDWFHLTGTSLGKHHDYLGRDEVGATRFSVFITFDFPLDVPDARRRQVIDSVMATVEVER